MITTRPATPGDEPFLLALTERLADFPVPPWRSHEEIVQADHRILLAALHQNAGGIAILVAEDASGEPLGYAFAASKIDYFTRAACAHVEVVAVLEAAQGRGVASTLLAALEEWARTAGYSAITLNVFATNTRARGLSGWRARRETSSGWHARRPGV